MAGNAGAKAIVWRDLSGRIAGIELPRPAFRVFRSPVDFAAYQRTAMPGAAPRPARVDFRRDELVLVSPGPRSSTGYGVRIVAVDGRGRSILVTVRELTPSLGDPVRAGVTYPYRLIAISRTAKSVHVHWQGH